MSDEPYPYRTSDRRVIPWLLFGLLVLFGGLYVAGYLLTSDRVPRGTTVAGVQIGGLHPAAARTALGDALADERVAPIEVTAFGTSRRVDPGAAGLDVDLAASVEQAGGGRSWDPGRMWASLTSGDSFDPVVSVDTRALDAAVDDLARELGRPAKDGAVVFRGDEAVAKPPRVGERIQRAAAAAQIRDAYLHPGPAVELPTEEVQPEIDRGDVSAAMNDFANPAVAAAVVIEAADERVVLQPEDFAPTLSMLAQDGVLVPELDEALLLRRVETRLKTSALAPRDATVALVRGRPQVIPARKGLSFDEDELVAGFLTVVAAQGDARTIRVGTVVEKPAVSTAEVRKLGIEEKVSEFTTYFPHADYRNTNLGRAAELVDGTVLEPGEEFSLNDVVGERTASNGFTKGFIISDGVFKEDFGGGVSQVATTTFNAMFFAGLEDVEHKPHSFYIDRYPVGREATVAWPSVDLRFRNDTPYGVLVQAFVDPSTPSSPGAMTVRMWSTKVWDIRAGQSERYDFTAPATRRLSGEGCVPNTGYGGFDIDVYRDFYRPGSDERVRRETFHTTYTPSDSVICS
ncbi:VanW family protein [Nocardioides mesophilus]|uniref:VanW family protein n=1 Tax=Nocardioides mesophilus TaxID=433659 RepID=A0A7G9R7Y8_9ACTN|nr:VanW family protein [Nocardioides mesophilus]QNN51713.1 VanW family protein [Nocardioides mesophilus]